MIHVVAILLDTKYADSIWCKNLYSSLTERLREKRIPFCEIFDSCPGDAETVFIIGSDLAWTSSAIKQLNAGGMTPILLCNQTENLPGCLYNCVCSDINASMKNLLDILKGRQKTRLAIYGMNPDSIPDISRTDSLMLWKDNSFEKFKLFQNQGSLADCFDSFYLHIDEFDAVVCTNDFAAISLVKKLEKTAPDQLERLLIASCASSQLSEYYRKNILSLDIHYGQYGKAAVYIYEALQKHRYLSGLTVKVTWDIDKDNKLVPSGPISVNPSHSADTFYDDPELNEMLVVDKLLTLSDDTDKKIIDALLIDSSYEEMAKHCFLSMNAVKYRIKKLISDSGAEDKQQMAFLLKKYIK